MKFIRSVPFDQAGWTSSAPRLRRSIQRQTFNQKAIDLIRLSKARLYPPREKCTVNYLDTQKSCAAQQRFPFNQPLALLPADERRSATGRSSASASQGNGELLLAGPLILDPGGFYNKDRGSGVEKVQLIEKWVRAHARTHGPTRDI